VTYVTMLELVHPAQLFQNGYNYFPIVASRHFGYVLTHKKNIIH